MRGAFGAGQTIGAATTQLAAAFGRELHLGGSQMTFVGARHASPWRVTRNFQYRNDHDTTRS